MKKREYPEVEHKRSKHLEKLLLSRGVDYCNLLRANAHFDFEDALVKIDGVIPNVTRQSVPIKKQYTAIQSILNNPLRGSYVLGISSFPSDLRAKQLAVQVMRNATRAVDIKGIKKDYPLWHKLNGSFRDNIRDNENDLPASMLILSNVNNESTAVKIEKLRDILERYSSIPRIVVIGGVDPITFFANKLHFPLTAGIYLGPVNRVRDEI